MTTRIRFRAAGFDARPYRPSSLRAQAQRSFVSAAGQDNMLRHHEAGSRIETLTPLTLKARDLYENSVVPVREIARLVGVSERTLYKYARKFDWRGRYAGQGAKPAKPAAAKHRPSRCDA